MKTNKYALFEIYLLSRSLSLGLLFSYSFFLVGTNAIISFIFGILLGISFTFIYSKIKLNKKTKLFEILLYLFFILLSSIIITTFISSFFLNKTPKIFIILPSILLCYYISLKDKEVIKWLSTILTIFSILTIIFNFFALIPHMEIKNILPLFTFKNKNMIKSILFYAIVSSCPLLTLNNENYTTKDYILSYIITNIIILIICFAIISILGRNLITMYSYPEYMVLKKIQISSFIENVENFISLIWLFDLYYLIIHSIKKINIILKPKIGNTLILLIVFINSFVINNNNEYLFYIYQKVPYILYILVIPILILSDKKRVNYNHLEI